MLSYITEILDKYTQKKKPKKTLHCQVPYYHLMVEDLEYNKYPSVSMS